MTWLRPPKYLAAIDDHGQGHQSASPTLDIKVILAGKNAL